MNPSNPWSGPYQNPHTGAPIPDPRTNTRVPSYTSNSTSPFTSTMTMSAQGSERRDGGPLMMNRKNKKQKEEGYEDRERINRATVILGSRELLVFHGMGNDEVCYVLFLSCIQSLLSGEWIARNGWYFLLHRTKSFGSLGGRLTRHRLSLKLDCASRSNFAGLRTTTGMMGLGLMLLRRKRIRVGRWDGALTGRRGRAV
jgi:hypothetical protein